MGSFLFFHSNKSRILDSIGVIKEALIMYKVKKKIHKKYASKLLDFNESFNFSTIQLSQSLLHFPLSIIKTTYL